jgi:hypothetical protein
VADNSEHHDERYWQDRESPITSNMRVAIGELAFTLVAAKSRVQPAIRLQLK